MKTKQAIQSVLFVSFFMLALSVFNDTSAQVRNRIIHQRIENRFDRREDVRDRREDIQDRREDVRDRLEDVRDANNTD